MCVCVCVFAQVCAPIKRKATVACRCGTFFNHGAHLCQKNNAKKSVILDVNPDGGGGGGSGGGG